MAGVQLCVIGGAVGEADELWYMTAQEDAMEFYGCSLDF